MTLDIARILRYARVDGTLSPTPVRMHVAMVDGIIAGEGEGPLRPTPRRTGLVGFGDDICAVDAACALLMGYDPSIIPLIRNSLGSMSLPLSDQTLDQLTLTLNAGLISPSDLVSRFSPAFKAPKGWRGLSTFAA